MDPALAIAFIVAMTLVAALVFLPLDRKSAPAAPIIDDLLAEVGVLQDDLAELRAALLAITTAVVPPPPPAPVDTVAILAAVRDLMYPYEAPPPPPPMQDPARAANYPTSPIADPAAIVLRDNTPVNLSGLPDLDMDPAASIFTPYIDPRHPSQYQPQPDAFDPFDRGMGIDGEQAGVILDFDAARDLRGNP